MFHFLQIPLQSSCVHHARHVNVVFSLHLYLRFQILTVNPPRDPQPHSRYLLSTNPRFAFLKKRSSPTDSPISLELLLRVYKIPSLISFPYQKRRWSCHHMDSWFYDGLLFTHYKSPSHTSTECTGGRQHFFHCCPTRGWKSVCYNTQHTSTLWKSAILNLLNFSSFKPLALYRVKVT